MPAEIVIVDDDPVVGNLTSDVLRDVGFTTLWVRDCLQAESVIKTVKPRLAILDIMMPGVDGITLLTSLKADPATKDIKCIVVSGKSYPADKKRALEKGAELYLEKPFDVDAFPKTIVGLIGQPAGKPDPASQVPKPTVTLRVWGSRGPDAPAPAGSKAGVNGPCIVVETPDRAIAFDAGTGLIPFGLDLLKRAPQKDVWVLLTHTHPGHLAGLLEFAPAATPNRGLKIAGPSSSEGKLKEIVKETLLAAKNRTLAKVELFELFEDSYELAPGLRLSGMYAHHPGTTLALSLELETRKIVYVGDSELAGEAASSMSDYDEKLARFARGADLLIHDSQFGPKDPTAGTGHSSSAAAIQLARAANAKALWLTHLNPAYTDAQIDEIEAQAKADAEKVGVRCLVAREGLTEQV
jgi:ribonuclease BN (tRNA processing enzyme)/ActR/RegA family two-component response regulator